MKSVSVITSSIGRKELAQCVESVLSQTYECKHYVYVNGPKWHERAKETLNKFPEVKAFYLPEETGDYGHGPCMSDVFAAAPYLTRSDWVFYLNDDDFYDHNHVETVMKHVNDHDLKWCYSLRKFVDINGNYIVDDDWNSLGHWHCVGDENQYLVDNSCFAVDRVVAQRLGQAWAMLPYVADRAFLAALKSSKLPYGCTALATVNYRVGTGSALPDREIYIEAARITKEKFPGGYPWRTPLVVKHDS